MAKSSEDINNVQNTHEVNQKKDKQGNEIRRSYMNMRLSGAYSGLRGFLLNRKKWTDKKLADKELRKLDFYTSYKPVRRKFRRRRIMTYWKNMTWTTDLKDISNIAEYNNCYNWILTVTDTFSKYSYTRPLKNKTASQMITAFKSIIKEAQTVPDYVFSDKGKEYTAKKVQEFFKSKNITWYHVYSEMKASMSEVFIKNLFSKLERYKAAKNTKNIVRVLQDFTKSYNSTYNRAIGLYIKFDYTLSCKNNKYIYIITLQYIQTHMYVRYVS
jgi:transposase InsO family protein